MDRKDIDMEEFIDELSEKESVPMLTDEEGVIGHMDEVRDEDESCKAPELGPNQWAEVYEDCYRPSGKVISKINPGYYTIHSNPNVGIFLAKKNVYLNKIYRLKNSASETILNDIGKFWQSEEQYKKYERVFKRNYLIYSAPGTGKSSLIQLMCQDLLEQYHGIILSIVDTDDLRMLPEAMTFIKKIEPDRRIIVILEDIDAYLNTTASSMLLNILDGTMRCNGVVFIATTNYIEKLEARYKNRPSRFDLVIEFPLPNAESRRMFMEKSIFPDDIEKIDVDKWVRRTEGFTIDHINELILLYFVFGHDEEEAFSRIEKMVKENDFIKNDKSVSNKRRGISLSSDDDEMLY